jgi:GT2 family glycosyltransferase
MKSGHKVSIGVCDPGTVNGDFAFKLVQLAQVRSARLGPFVRIKGNGLLSKLRNRVVQTFLDSTDSDWLLLIDSDEQLSPAVFDQLIDTAHHIERPVVAGLVFAAFKVDGEPYPKPVPAIFQDTPQGFLPLFKYDRNAIFQIDACGTGCVLIHRSVLEKMREMADPHQGTNWCWFWDGPLNGEWISEDLLFSRRVRQLGFPIHVNTAAILPHQKSYWLDERHHIAWQLNENS